MSKSFKRFLLTILMFSAGSMPAYAHPFHEAGEAIGFGSGLLHPFSSSDHILMMLFVGLWICRSGHGRAVVSLALTFLALLLLGGAMALVPLEIAHPETLMYAGILVLGLLLASGRQLHWALSLSVIAGVAVCHGYAHAYDIWLDSDALGYTAGFTLATLSQLALGVAANRAIPALLVGPARRDAARIN
ncbi:HupE/UreJ family protein [Methylomonas koyamae]|uniref:HupE/UreJ family protein n=1 Tax=Methylomonas koyamae TaxID=702114 RepID=UPI00112AE221|nr:HupE/UreJ family protein [Methylomonas koyamae]TPQ29457.1 urease accessory protein UreJ [Methylomonas koyamae]